MNNVLTTVFDMNYTVHTCHYMNVGTWHSSEAQTDVNIRTTYMAHEIFQNLKQHHVQCHKFTLYGILGDGNAIHKCQCINKYSCLFIDMIYHCRKDMEFFKKTTMQTQDPGVCTRV